MATTKKASTSRDNIRLADNNGARKRFGFGGAPGTGLQPIKTAPKMSDMWYVEFRQPGKKPLDISAQARTVSPISVSTTSIPLDKYGKRVHIPTRVDFPEVTVTLYDTVDGKLMYTAAEIYSQFFKNNNLGTSTDQIEATISDINSGRKFSDIGQSFHKNFEKFTIFHFYGNLDTDGSGFIQKIELINPLVTNITFSQSDYSSSELRTIDFTLQPENVIFGKPITSNLAEPDWMREGLEFVLNNGMSPSNSNNSRTSTIVNTLDAFGTQLGQTANLGSRLRGNIRAKGQLETFNVETNPLAGIDDNSEVESFDTTVQNVGSRLRGNLYGKEMLSQFDTFATGIDNEVGYEDRLNQLLEGYGFDSGSTEAQGAREAAIKKAEAEQLKALSKLYAELNAAEESRNADAAQDAMNSMLEARNTAIPMSADSLNNFERTDTSNNAYTTNTLYPDVATFSGLGSQAVGLDRFSGGDLGQIITQELVGSFFNGRKVNIGNITNAVAQGVLGNSGVGTLGSLSETSQSRFGIAGDIIRDGIINSAKRRNTQPVTNTTVPSSQSTPSVKTTTQSNIGTLKSITKGFLR